MDKLKFSVVVLITSFLFFILTIIYYNNTQEIAINNAKEKINDLLLNYKAFRTYVSKVQKEEVYKLQGQGQIDSEYFDPALLSSTFSAKNVNNFYNKFREELYKKPILIRFASDNPRNPKNKATKSESELLKKFNNNEIDEYIEVQEDSDGKTLYYVLPTKKNAQRCMRCHSDPSYAPKGLIDLYGDVNGFHEKKGDIRAILSTSYPLDDDLVKANKTFWILTSITFVILLIILIIVYAFTKKLKDANKSLDEKVVQRTRELLEEKEYIKTILDVNPSIIIVTNNSSIINANKQFFNFFECETLFEFKRDARCICDYFVEFDKETFPPNKVIKNKLWSEYLSSSDDKTHYVTIKYKGEFSDFIISGATLNDAGDTLITLHNITEQVQKDKLLFEQSKLASMGEMIGNIAHQWRQPLSIISTSATGMQIQKEYGLLDDKVFNSACETIEENAQYLSKTIDDFRNFIKGDREKTNFSLTENIESFLKLVDSTTKNMHIKVNVKLENNIKIYGYSNELIQCFMNIYNNSKDALKDVNEDDRLIFISSFIKDDMIHIIFKDSAGGIPEGIISKIFEPYFTTKHQSQGTGLGLHMTYNLIVDGMDGSISVSNEKYIHDKKGYIGAQFIIKLPV